ncbi:glutamate synthase-related protein [Desulfobacca acetoxidans]|uniref:glutamate synthase (NADPH) n=1 Tax=Desulfobacca acetoxidans (strain ATCC 700848 / DSM 11109 / ASRB2) TaxID=880072 RepID=F2NH60_DESAR|nr:glutamate synthase-related protein [Desulfobacca acetoxidans]AEB08902.1 Glutamate synthase (NADPH) [Desulfobacca acetoxidans DSM 11109]HAY20660.1 FMN-binding glutamate synthase family protein [Desulfobacterales bacterium]
MTQSAEKIDTENGPQYIEPVITGCRFKNPLSKYRVVRDEKRCTRCGRCVELCPYGVHTWAGEYLRRPLSYRCLGFKCKTQSFYCIDQCPEKALRLVQNPNYQSFGDKRWSSDLLLSTWWMAEFGTLPYTDIEYRTGDSGGGFDKMRFIFPREFKDSKLSHEEISLELVLNRRADGRPQVKLSVPWYGGGMSFGSISLHTMLARARAVVKWNTMTCTGEGGYPDALMPYDDHIITQVATGLFGVREDTIQRVRIVEFKYAQGAKPGLGGHLLGDKVTPEVARMREAVTGSALFSPFPFHSVYSVEDHKKHVDWIKEVNPRCLVSVKVSTPTDVDMVAVGSYDAGAHIIHLDGSYGGTGAAPDIAKKNIAMPIEYAIPKVHQFLRNEGIRDRITLIASGGLRTAFDVAKAIALGADGVVIGTAEMVALECTRCYNCESGRGCPRGIATTDPEMTQLMQVDWGLNRISNMYHAWAWQLKEILRRLGLRSITELVGRTDLLVHLDYYDRPVEDDLRRGAPLKG